MKRTIEDYIDVVGEQVIAAIHRRARRLYDRHVFHLNSTFQGGGVAEILSRVVPLMNDAGIDMGWRILHGNPAFYDVTKKFHNALQGGDVEITADDRKLYLEVNEEFASYTHIDHDFVFVHDPQPLPMVRFCAKQQPWVWRCHIDLTEPHAELWKFLKMYLLRYDLVIVSSEGYRKNDLPIEQRVVCPAIDPLSLKNRRQGADEVRSYAREQGIPTDKPIIMQVSRMDPWKDPEGVLDVFMKVREKVDCRLVFCYNLASDDPEGISIYDRVQAKVHESGLSKDVLFVLGNNDNLVNAMQTLATVIIQKSIREGFCLTVTEAMWKAKPVVATTAGGIPSQIADGENGFLVDPHDLDGCADRVVEILKNPSLGEKLGNAGRESVRQNFLTPRLMTDYLDIILELVE